MADSKQEPLVWYFAYGANMASAVTNRRGIHAVAVAADVTVPTHCLSFDLLGVPYNEPALASVRPLRSPSDKPVRGVAHQITEADLARLITSEGGGIAYRTVTLRAVFRDGRESEVVSLAARNPATMPRRPSRRYLGLLLQGAREHQLDQEYQEWLALCPTFQPSQSWRFQLGKTLFDVFWLRVQRGIQWGIARFKQASGHVPWWFVVMFDLVLNFMWAYHDIFHSRIWGRGDGV